MRTTLSSGRARPGILTVPALATLLAGLVVTAILYASIHSLERERASVDFDQRADTYFAAVAGSFGEAISAMRALNLLFVATDDVRRDEFEAFARPLLEQNHYLQALVFHRFVNAAERPRFEAERRRYWPGFEIRERVNGTLRRAGSRERYLVADYIVPLAGNETTFGYDGWSYPPQRALIEQAIDSGGPTASPAVTLLQGDGTRRGVVIFMAVYREGGIPADLARRRREVIGDTAVVIDVATLVEGSLRRARLLEAPDFALEVRGPVLEGGVRTVYRHGPSGAAARSWVAQALSGPDFAETRGFDVAAGRWQVRVSRHGSGPDAHLGSAASLLFGVVLSLMSALYVQSRAVRTRHIESLVAQRTADLRRASDVLRLYQRAIDASASPIMLISATQPGYPIEYANPACERLFGKGADELRGLPLAQVARADPDQPAVAELRGAMRDRREGRALLHQQGADGREFWTEVYIAPVNDAAGVTEHFVISQYDVTTAKRYEAELEHRARHDTLTGLANRSLLADRIERAIAADPEAPVWVVTIDLDRFKVINDTLGHQAGDQLLVQLAGRISAAVRPADTVARTGGDDFVLVLTGRADERQAAATVAMVRDAITAPLTVDGHSLIVTCSAGVAGYPADGRDPATLVKHAEVAMYRAKENGRDVVQFYTPKMNDRARERLDLESALRGALRHDQFELHFQPQVHLASGCVAGTEALIRWRHPQLGLVHPDRFIGLAEETGLIVPIGTWAMRSACLQNCRWRDAGLAPLRIAVNLSARQFAEPGLVETVAQVLDQTGLDPGALEIELTESVMMADVDVAIHTMRSLKSMGVKLAIDDFGTGYSSLAYLRRFPVDVLKIDRSFVRDIDAGAESAALVDAIVALAHGLHIHVIAEGVETMAQLEHLRASGCDEVQGNIFSRPLAAAELEPMLREGGRLRPASVAA